MACLVNSTYGRGFLAVHDDEVAAEAMGVNPTKYKIIAFVVGAFFAGMAGGLYGHFKLSIDPKGFDFIKSIEIVVMVILGGMGNTVGVIIAAVLLTILPEVLRPVAEYRMMLYSLLLIVLMLTHLAWGNLVSVFEPRRTGPHRFSSAGDPLTGLATMLIGSIPGVAVVVLLRLGSRVSALAIVAIVLLTMAAYYGSLRYAGRSFERRIEIISSRLA